MRYSRPTMVQFEITNRCNLRCLHCYHLDSIENIKERQDLDDASTLKIMQKILESEIFGITFTGGEPFSRKNILAKCLEMCQAYKLSININTNLMLLDEEIISLIENSNVSGLLISCPTVDPELFKVMTRGGDYKLFEKKLKMLADYLNHPQRTVKLNNSFQFKIDQCSINMVVNKRNVDHIRSTAIRMKEFGIKWFCASPMTIGSSMSQERAFLLSNEELLKVVNDLLWIRDHLGLSVDVTDALPKCAFPKNILDMNLSFLQKMCSAGESTAQISNQGNVRACPDSEDNFGNILEESLEQIFLKMNQWRNGDFLPAECKECSALSVCNGGCRVQAYNCTKLRNGKDPWMTSKIETPLISSCNCHKNENADAAHAHDHEHNHEHNDHTHEHSHHDDSCACQSHSMDNDLNSNTEIIFDKGDLLVHRLEFKDQGVYLLYNLYNMKSIFVKKHFLDFINDIQTKFTANHSITLQEIASTYKVEANNPYFQQVISYLLSIEFAKIVNNNNNNNNNDDIAVNA